MVPPGKVGGREAFHVIRTSPNAARVSFVVVNTAEQRELPKGEMDILMSEP